MALLQLNLAMIEKKTKKKKYWKNFKKTGINKLSVRRISKFVETKS